MVAKTGREGKWEMTSNGYRFYFWSDKNVPELDQALVVQLCEYAKITRLYTFKG